MKVIYIHQYFNTPSMNGSTRSFEMARRLVSYGHEVEMVTTDRRIQNDSCGGWYTTVEEGITVHWLSLEYSNNMSYAKRLCAFARFAYRAAAKAKSLGGDVIFASSTPLTISIPAVYASKRNTIPMVFEVRDLWPELPIEVGAIKNPVTKWFARKLERFSYKHSRAVVTLSPGMRQGVIRTGYDSSLITVIPNSCDTAVFKVDSVVGEEWRRGKGWLKDRPLVLYAGTVGLINDLKYMVRLAHETEKIDPEIRFLIVGDGRERDEVASFARDMRVLNRNLFMMDPVPKCEIPSILSAATICSNICANIKAVWNNSANKYFDTLAAGKPVMINFEGWQADIIRDYNVGIVLDYNDISASAKRLVEHIRNAAWLSEASDASIRLAEEKFCRDKLAKQLESVLMNVCVNGVQQGNPCDKETV